MRRFFARRFFGYVPGWLALILVLGGTAAATAPVFNGIVTTPNTTGGNYGYGFNALAANTTGTGSSAFGFQALANNTTGTQNTAFGYNALNANVLGVANVAVGYYALSNENASQPSGMNGLDTAIGYQALFSCTTCAQLTAVGYQALYFNSTGAWNSAVGTQTLYNTTTGSWNTGDGYSAGYAITTANDNTAVGSLSMETNSTGNDNTAVGFDSMYFGTGGDNACVGSSCMYHLTTANDNTTLGFKSLFTDTIGGDNVALGFQSLLGLTTGLQNVAIGSSLDAGSFNQVTTGSQNVAIGYDVAVPSATANGQLDIQNAIYGTGNTGTLTTLSAGCIMLFSATCPGSTQFYVNGSAQFSGGVTTVGLTSTNGVTELKNATGNADIYVDADTGGQNYIESANSARNANVQLNITGTGAGKGSNLYLNFATIELHGQLTQQATCLDACKVTLVSGAATWTFGAAYTVAPSCTATAEGAPPSTTVSIALPTVTTTAVTVSAYTSSGTVNTADTRTVNIHCIGYPN